MLFKNIKKILSIKSLQAPLKIYLLSGMFLVGSWVGLAENPFIWADEDIVFSYDIEWISNRTNVREWR
jgi:hypothetical protein